MFRMASRSTIYNHSLSVRVICYYFIDIAGNIILSVNPQQFCMYLNVFIVVKFILEKSVKDLSFSWQI